MPCSTTLSMVCERKWNSVYFPHDSSKRNLKSQFNQLQKHIQNNLISSFDITCYNPVRSALVLFLHHSCVYKLKTCLFSQAYGWLLYLFVCVCVRFNVSSGFFTYTLMLFISSTQLCLQWKAHYKEMCCLNKIAIWRHVCFTHCNCIFTPNNPLN